MPGLVEFLETVDGVHHTGQAGAGSLKRTPHVAIEGENLRVLNMLLPALRQKVDLIYLDPPYSSGEQIASYENRFGSKSDWAAFLSPRISIGREMLSSTGVIAVSVGDRKLPLLRILMDELFGEGNYLATLVHQGGIKNSARFTGAGVEYIVIYARDRRALHSADVRWREPKVGVQDVLAAGSRAWTHSDGNAAIATAMLREWWQKREFDFAPGLHEYSRVDSAGRVFRIAYLGAKAGKGGGRYIVNHPVSGVQVANPPADWVATARTMQKWIEEDRIEFFSDPGRVPARKLFLDEMTQQAPLPTFTQRRDRGTKRLREILGAELFDHPKDPEILARWFAMIAPRDAVVLDFFAGSGTTAEAVMMLNRSDDGRRRTVLVSNNERIGANSSRSVNPGVFSDVLRPRLETLISGFRPDGSEFSGGLSEKVHFFRA